MFGKYYHRFIDVSTLTTPSIVFIKKNVNTSTNVGNNVLTVDVFDGQELPYGLVWAIG